MPGQMLQRGNQRSRADLELPESAYFGADPDDVLNADTFGLRPRPDRQQELYRVSYLYLLVFGNDQSATDYGGMQLRAETFLWAEQGSIPTRLQRLIQHTAHRAAHIFDSGVQHPAYGANEWANGYLSGFDPWENGADYDNWEVEPVAANEVHTAPGVIDWSTEIYQEVDGLDYANLSGIATGLSNPWEHETRHRDGQEAIHITPHKWRIGWEPSRRDGKGEYFVRPPAHKRASDRYRDGAGAGKDVYVNGLKIGGLGPKGRVWLSPEYGIGGGLEYQGNHSRAGLIEESDDATPQALRDGGVLYMTGETEGEVYLRTSRALPDDYRPGDPDDVSVHMEAQEGRPGGTDHFLGLQDVDEPLKIACQEDREVIAHMGFSSPPHTNHLDDDELFRWPGFRPIEEYGRVETPGSDRDGGQSGLGEFSGGGGR